MFKRLAHSALLLTLILNAAFPAYGATHAGAKIYLAPQGGFETYLAAAFKKKHVKVTVVDDIEDSDFVLEAAPVEYKVERTGSTLTRCTFLYCPGMEGIESTTVRLIDKKGKITVWSYPVHKGHQREQSLAEAVAKHLANEFVNKWIPYSR